jgi:hypothetical protein
MPVCELRSGPEKHRLHDQNHLHLQPWLGTRLTVKQVEISSILHFVNRHCRFMNAFVANERRSSLQRWL